MDTGNTIQKVRKEYREYLSAAHPEWAKSTISTYVSDAFYLYQNSVVPSLWNCLENEETMACAREEIFNYMKYEAIAEHADERAEGYYKNLVRLKEFVDLNGGVRSYIGYEFDCEETIYKYAKKTYVGEISFEDAVQAMCDEVPCFGQTTHKLMVRLFASMIEGKKYTRRANTDITLCFISSIGRDFGKEKMVNALRATLDNILYYYEKTGYKSGCFRRGCKKITYENDIDISFDDDIFDGITPRSSTDVILAEEVPTLHYWLYSPGDDAANWDEFYAAGIMGIGWDKIGDFSVFDSKDEMKEKMKEVIDPSKSYRNDAHATWQFANEMKAGDIVFAKKGLHLIVGRGVVESDYEYAPDRREYKNIRKVKWTDKGQWQTPSQSSAKTLTDITPYTEYVEKLNALFESDISGEPYEPEIEYETYNTENFLKDVYMDEESYDTLVALVRNKKNVILQGAPGVGKTFAAKRLAYSMMGVKDPNRVKMVQFHQSYSYEDFIMGFRPSEKGFELKRGAFYNFCKEAEIDSENEYFFIIDEINRGNLSKIFGELFMLIESDKRGVELELLYSDEKFSVPENVYLIGMMNTADRSLAMMDYALRRRFAFFEMKPGFDTEGFREYRMRLGSDKFDRLISCVENLNAVIAADESLGEGFCIGHSYFCNLKEATDKALSGIVEFELIPLLKEYWFDEPVRVKDWTNNLRSAVK